MCASPPAVICSFSSRQERSIFTSSNQQAGLHILASRPRSFVVPLLFCIHLHPSSFFSSRPPSPSIFGPSPALFGNASHHFHCIHILLNFILSLHPDLCWLCSISGTLLSPPTPHHTSSTTHSHHAQRSYHRGSYALPPGLDPGQSCTCAFPSQHVPTITACPQFSHSSS